MVLYRTVCALALRLYASIVRQTSALGVAPSGKLATHWLMADRNRMNIRPRWCAVGGGWECYGLSADYYITH